MKTKLSIHRQSAGKIDEIVSHLGD